jgi:glutamate-1-semialdehyde 2,1-aminomutase
MAATDSNCIDRTKLYAIRKREDALFSSRTTHSTRILGRALQHMPGGVPMGWMKGLYRTPPIYVDRGEGPRFVDADGNSYLDFNVCDLSMTMGYGPEAIVDAVTRQIRRGAHFLLPTEDAVVVSDLLAERTRVPYWQFTLSASGSNTEVLRIARFLTGRSKVVVFAGHYHGHIDETLVAMGDDKLEPALLGLPPDAASNTHILPFNSLESLETVLEEEDIALVLTEPALTNCNIVLPQPNYLAGVRELTRQHGTLLCLDEAHTFQFAYGGLVGAWQLDSDFVVLGKGLGTGISFGLYGMSEEIAEVFANHMDVDTGPSGIATGGTLYGSAIALATARAALVDMLTPDAYDNVNALGKRLADGLDGLFVSKNLPWTAFRLGPRSGYCLSETLPVNYDEARISLDYELIDTRRVFMANRGIWDAVASAGPQASFANSERDVDEYLSVADEFLSEIVA